MSYPGRRPPMGESDWLTLGQAAKFLGVAQSTIRKWSDIGRVPAFYTPGGHRRFRRADLDAFLDRSGPGKPARGPLVLVVDDDPQVREVVRINLEIEGYTVREAGNAEEGLGTVGGIWIAIALVLAVVWRRWGLLIMTAAAVAISDLAARLLKTAIDVQRPSTRYAEPKPLVSAPHDHSFPSGHAATSFAAM